MRGLRVGYGEMTASLGGPSAHPHCFIALLTCLPATACRGAAGRLDAETLGVTKRVQKLLSKLPRDINPVNLEELRRVKSALVELENKADTVRCDAVGQGLGQGGGRRARARGGGGGPGAGPGPTRGGGEEGQGQASWQVGRPAGMQ